MANSRHWLLTVAFSGTAYLMWDALEPARVRGESRPEAEAVTPFEPPAPAVPPNPAVFTRDPFGQRVMAEETAAAATSSWTLQGIVLGREERFALLNGLRVRVGTLVDGFTVQAIERDRVVLQRDADKVEIGLPGTQRQPLAPDAALPAPRLSAVMTSARRKVAILDGQIVRQGESWNGLLLETVRVDGATLVRGDQKLELSLDRPVPAGLSVSFGAPAARAN